VEAWENTVAELPAIGSASGDPTTHAVRLSTEVPRIHVVPTTGEPLGAHHPDPHPEIVVFGHEQRLKDVSLLRPANEFSSRRWKTATCAPANTIGTGTVYEAFPPRPGQADSHRGQAGGGYSEVIQCLQDAKKRAVWRGGSLSKLCRGRPRSSTATTIAA